MLCFIIFAVFSSVNIVKAARIGEFTMKDDGAYAFSYQINDGTFREETRDVNGKVFVKYGLMDELGGEEVTNSAKTVPIAQEREEQNRKQVKISRKFSFR